jgi:hypothetical protein
MRSHSLRYDAPALTSPVEASFRLESAAAAAAAAPVPDLVHSPPRRSATFPRRRPDRQPLTSATYEPPSYGVGGVSMLRSISQPVLTGAEHAEYTASRAASLGRVAGAYARGELGSRRGSGGLSRRGSGQRSIRSGRGTHARPSLTDILGALEDDDGDVEMEEPAPRADRLASAPSFVNAFSTEPAAFPPPYPPYEPPASAPPAAQSQYPHAPSPPAAYSPSQHPSPREYEPRTPSPAPSPRDPHAYARTPSPSPTARPDLRAYAPRTPSPAATSRLTPTSGRSVRIRPRESSPTPSTSSRAAAWRARAGRCLPRFEVQEAALGI